MRVWTTFTVLVALSSPISASAPEMRPIKDFLIENADASNGGTEVFIGLRCSSIFSIMEKYAADNGMADASTKFKEASFAALKFAADNQNPFDKGYISGQMKLMIESYADRFLKSKAMTGNFSDDEVISSDIETCGEIF